MLRRRRRTPKPPSAPAPRAGAVPGSRRRARPDAPVPPELIVTPQLRERAKARAGAQPAKAPAKAQAPKASAGGADDVVLVTGFEPFGGDARNPSWEVCERLPGAIAGLRVEVCRVACEFRRSIEALAEAIERHRPALVVCLGLAPGRTHLGVERVAINVDDARIADNAGAQPVDEPIAASGPAAYFATLPVKVMVAAMRAAGVPAEVSNSAGTYVCNHLMYGVLHYLAASGTRARAGLIHLPYADEQVLGKPQVASMALATMVKGVETAIAAAQDTTRDVKLAAGRID